MKKGYLVIGTIAFLTVICWLITPSLPEVSLLNGLSQLLGAGALVGFACANAISTRHPWIDTLFHGLDKAYNTHKWLGVISVGLVLTHIILLIADRDPAPVTGDRAEHFFSHLGIPSGVLFFVLLLIALLAKRMKYERWKTFHKFLVLPYAIGVVHFYGSSLYATLSSPFGLWMIFVNLVGISSALYSLFLYEKTAFSFRYKVTALRPLTKDTIEITGTAAKKALVFRPGQFTFLKVTGKNCSIPSHPFTLSGTSGQDTIQFTIKNLGTHTDQLITALQTEDALTVTAPHGVFDYTTGGKQQIWIAGGIGITPFRSFYLADIPESFSIDFFYAYHGEEEGTYLDELRTLPHKNLRLHFIDDTVQGFLTLDIIQKHFSGKDPVDIYFCGPKPMRESLRSALKKNQHINSKVPARSDVPASSSLRVRGFHFDEFNFGRG